MLVGTLIFSNICIANELESTSNNQNSLTNNATQRLQSLLNLIPSAQNIGYSIPLNDHCNNVHNYSKTSEDLNRNQAPLNADQALLAAVEENNIYEVERLIQLGANVNAKTEDNYTPLHVAVNYGSEDKKDIVELLLSKGADINAKANDGDTPLYKAIIHSKIEIARFLIDNGSDVNIQNSHGLTPLHWAAIRDYKEIVELLLRARANKNIKATRGFCANKTPADAAKTQEIKDLINSAMYLSKR